MANNWNNLIHVLLFVKRYVHETIEKFTWCVQLLLLSSGMKHEACGESRIAFDKNSNSSIPLSPPLLILLLFRIQFESSVSKDEKTKSAQSISFYFSVFLVSFFFIFLIFLLFI